MSKLGDINLEVIRSMRKIAITSIRTSGNDVLTLHYYSEMVKASEKEKFYFLYRVIIDASAEILNESIQAGVSDRGMKIEFEQVETICSIILKRLNKDDALNAFLPLIESSSGFPNNIRMMVTNLLNLKNRVDDDSAIAVIERHAFDTIPYVNGLLIKIISLAVGSKNFAIVKYSMNTFYDIVIILLNQKLAAEQDFNKEIYRLIKAIYYFFTELFVDDDSLDDSSLDDILDLSSIPISGVYHIRQAKFDNRNR
jgi:hypothetical protein